MNTHTSAELENCEVFGGAGIPDEWEHWQIKRFRQIRQIEGLTEAAQLAHFTLNGDSLSQLGIFKVLRELYRPKMKSEKDADFVNRRRVGLIFHFELLTGSRKSEVENLLKSGIDQDGREIQVRGMKTRYSSVQTVRYVPMTTTIERVIVEGCAINKGDYVFTLSGSPTKNHYKFMREACARAGVKYGRSVTGGLTGHDARHTFVTRTMQAGKDLATVGSITGHADKTLTMRYSHASRESRAALMDVAEDFAGWNFDLPTDETNHAAS